MAGEGGEEDKQEELDEIKALKQFGNVNTTELRGLLKTAGSFNSSDTMSSSNDGMLKPSLNALADQMHNDKSPPASPDYQDKTNQKIVIDLRAATPAKSHPSPDDGKDSTDEDQRPGLSVPLCTPYVDTQTFQIFPTNQANMVHAYMGPNSQHICCTS